MTAHQRIDRPAEAAGSNRLPILAATINEHLEAAENAARRGLEHAIAAGKLLLEAKALVAHGEWIAWLDANCHVGVRQAIDRIAEEEMLSRAAVIRRALVWELRSCGIDERAPASSEVP